MNVVPITQADSPLDYALRYARLGWYVFPVWGGDGQGHCRCGGFCKSPGKHPISHIVPNGQDGATTDPERIRWMWAQDPHAGVAVHLSRSGLVAIDIDPRNGGFDSIEQIESLHGELASDVMAFTQGGGEHRIFKAGEISGIPGKLGPGIDVKFNGYVCIEPTLGVSGAYAWEGSSDPLEGAIPSPLPDWLRGLVVNTEKMAETTAATRAVIQSQIDELRDALKSLPADDRDTWVNFGNALWAMGQDGFLLWDEWSQKSDKYDPVDQMRVWRSFKPGPYQVESIFHVAQQGGWVNPLGGAAPVRLPEPSNEPLRLVEPKAEHSEPLTQAQISLQRPPGALGLFVDYYMATAAVPQPEFAVQSALALGSVVCGRHYKTARKTNFSNLWFMIVGKSGCGKEHPKTCISQVLRAAGKDQLLSDGYTSRAGIFSKLDIAPSHISIIDEIGRHLEVSKNNSSSHLRDAVSALMESFNRAHGVMQPPQYSLRNASKEVRDSLSAPIIKPCITLLGMTTPNTLYSTVDLDAIQDGFLGRFLLVETDIEGTDELTEEEVHEPPQALVDWVNAAMTHDAAEGNMAAINPAGLEPSVRTVLIRDRAWEVLQTHKRFEYNLKRQLEDQGVAELANRSVQKAFRVALVLSVSVNPHNPVITEELAQWASDYVRMTEERMIASVTRHLVSGRLGKLSKQVIEFIGKGGTKGRTLREIKNCHFGGHGRDLDEVLKLLVDSGRASYGELPEARRGRKRIAYVHNQFLAPSDEDADS